MDSIQSVLEALDKKPPMEYGIHLEDKPMGAEGVIIGEIVVAIMQMLAEKARVAGMKEEEVRNMMLNALGQVLDTKPEDLPTGPR